MDELHATGLIVSRREDSTGSARGSAGVRALDGVDLQLRSGECVAVMGGSGAGKSTLALALAGQVPLDAGRVAGRSVDSVSVVLQRPESTFLQETVLEEVSLALRWRGVDAVRAHERARELLRALGLPDDIEHRDPLTLSGGEQRRVAIAAVLATGARVLVLDEPSAGLDHAARRELHRALAAVRSAGHTVLVITHDPAEAAQLAPRLVVLQRGAKVWDGDAAQVLSSVAHARSLGIDVAPEVRLLDAVSRARGCEPPPTSGRPGDALDAIVGLLERVPRSRETRAGLVVAHPQSPQALSPYPPMAQHGRASRVALAPLVDARARLLAAALLVWAALAAQTLLAGVIIAACSTLVLGLARVGRRRVLLIVRPLVALAVMLVALQLIVDRESSVELYRGYASSLPARDAMLRSLQAVAITLATLALSGATASTSLAAAMRRLLLPLRVVRVPVDDVAFVVSTGLGMVPAFADELERLRLAQRIRGITPRQRGPVGRMRTDAMLLHPLFVAAFRRAHLLADALAVRGFHPAARSTEWRRSRVPSSDVVLLVGGLALVVAARLL